MIGWSIILCFIAAASLVWVTNWLALAPWRRARSAHWTERARLLHPVRLAARGNLFTVPVVVLLVQRIAWPESDLHWSGNLLGAWLGALAGTYPLDREVFPWMRFSFWLREAALYRILIVAHFLGLAGLFLIMPETINGQAWLVLLLAVAFQAWYTWGGMLRGLRWLGLLKSASPKVQNLTDNLARRMGMKRPKVWILRSTSANAFASPYTYTVLLTDRGLSQLSDEELSALMVHELGHLRESLSAKWVRFIGNLFFVPWLFLKPLYCGEAWAPLFIVLFIPLLLLHALIRLSRHMEEKADELALRHQDDQGAYAQALERIYQNNQAPVVMPGSQGIQPHLYDRMEAAGIRPDYPRPKPPAPMSWHGSMFCVLLVALVAILSDVHGFLHKGNSSSMAVEAETTEQTLDNPTIETNALHKKEGERLADPPRP